MSKSGEKRPLPLSPDGASTSSSAILSTLSSLFKRRRTTKAEEEKKDETSPHHNTVASPLPRLNLDRELDRKNVTFQIGVSSSTSTTTSTPPPLTPLRSTDMLKSVKSRKATPAPPPRRSLSTQRSEYKFTVAKSPFRRPPPRRKISKRNLERTKRILEEMVPIIPQNHQPKRTPVKMKRGLRDNVDPNYVSYQSFTAANKESKEKRRVSFSIKPSLSEPLPVQEPPEPVPVPFDPFNLPLDVLESTNMVRTLVLDFDSSAVTDSSLPREKKLPYDFVPAKSMQSPKPKSPMTSKANMFPKSTNWKCPACAIQNSETTETCASCETPKNGKGKQAKGRSTPTTPSAVSTPQTTTPAISTPKTKTPMTWGAKMFGNPTDWKCIACAIKNPKDVKECASCQTPKKVQEGATPSSGNQSAAAKGSSITIDEGGAKGGFLFGQPSDKKRVRSTEHDEQVTPASVGFSFKPETKQETKSGIGFQPKGKENQQVSTGFSFVQTKKKDNETGQTKKKDNETSAATFSLQKSVEKEQTSGKILFGQPVAEDKTSMPTKLTTGMAFGIIPNAGTEVQKEMKPPAPTFFFGQSVEKKEPSHPPKIPTGQAASNDESKEQSKPPVFTFGSTAETKGDKPAAVTFSFGQSAEKEGKPAGFSVGPPATTNNKSDEVKPIGLMFGQQPKEDPAGFSFPTATASKLDERMQKKKRRNQDDQEEASASAPFQFGTNAPAPAPAPTFTFGVDTAASQPSSSFAANTFNAPAPVAQTGFGSSTTAPAPAQTGFGASTTAPASVQTGFGSSTTAPAPAQTCFGTSTTAPATSNFNAPAPSSNFAFGASKPSQPAPSFAFGKDSSTPSYTPQTQSTSNFGNAPAPSLPAPASSFPAPAPAPAPASFNTGTTTTSQPASFTPQQPQPQPPTFTTSNFNTTPGFSFGAGNTPASSTFQSNNPAQSFNTFPNQSFTPSTTTFNQPQMNQPQMNQPQMNQPQQNQPTGGFSIGSAGPKKGPKRRIVRARRPPGTTG